MAAIDYLEGKSFMHRLDPRVKIISLLIFGVFIFTTKNFIVISGLFGLVLVLWINAKIPISRITGMLKLLIPLMAMVAIMQAIFQPGEIIIIKPLIPKAVPLIGGLGHITWEGVRYGLILAYRLVTLILVMPLFTLTTDINSMSLGFVKLGLPYQVAYMATTALNMIPSLTEQVKTIMDAQKLRGSTVFEEGSLKDKLLAYPALVVPMVIGAMKKAMLIGVAMDARAFACDKKRTFVEVLHFRTKDGIAMAVFLLYIVGLTVVNFVT